MIVLDSSAVIELFAGTKQGELVRDVIVNHPIALSALTTYEVFLDLSGNDADEFTSFIQNVHVLAFDLDTARKAVLIEQALGKKGHLIGKLDILIAATCLIHNLPLLTFDRDFSYVENLHLVSLKTA